jgi:aspartyl protease family protein
MKTLQQKIGLWFTLAGWALLLLLLALFARGFLEHEENPNRAARAVDAGKGQLEVVLRRNRAGHYVAPGSINGVAVNFLVDTGASLVAVDEKLGSRLGLERGATWSVQTANGVVRGWRTLIASLNVAGIEQHGVPAILLPALGEQVLLGMSFLKRVELVQRDDTLRLRQSMD